MLLQPEYSVHEHRVLDPHRPPFGFSVVYCDRVHTHLPQQARPIAISTGHVHDTLGICPLHQGFDHIQRLPRRTNATKVVEQGR